MASAQQQRAVVRQWLGSGAVNIFGRPFAGKDTQSHRLAAWTEGHVVSGGDLLRRRSDLPDDIRAIMNQGDLIPRAAYVAVIEPVLSQPAYEGRPLMLSAVGRYHGEEPSVLQAAKEAGHEVKAVFLLELAPKLIWERWELAQQSLDRGLRVDDHKDSLEVRLDVFEKKTLPVIAYYKEAGLLLEVDGAGTPDEVEVAILGALYERALAEA